MALVTDLQEFLFTTLKGIQDGTIDVDKAKAIKEVATTMVESAKVEVDFARVVGNVDSKFLQRQSLATPLLTNDSSADNPSAEKPALTNGKSTTANGGQVEKNGAITRHTLK